MDKIFKEIKGVFVKPKKSYYFGRLIHGTPYFYPRNFSNSILKVRKLKLTPQEKIDKLPNDFLKKAKKFSNLPMVRRSKDWIIKLFNNHYWVQIGWPFKIHRNDLGWKDKYESPRFEWTPSFQIYLFKWQFCIFWNSQDGNDDKYYEMILWYLYYSDKDIDKAKATWGWVDCETKESTWNDSYIAE